MEDWIDEPIVDPIVPELDRQRITSMSVLLPGSSESSPWMRRFYTVSGAVTGVIGAFLVGVAIPPNGRADDFSWPRGNVTLEPAANDPNATPDSAARTAKPAAERAPGADAAQAAQTAEAKPPPPRRPRPRRAQSL